MQDSATLTGWRQNQGQGRGTFSLSPMQYFTFVHAGRHFCNFSEIYPVKKKDCEQGRIKLLSVGELILSYTHRPGMRAHNINYLLTYDSYVPLYNRFHRGEWITRVSGGEGALDTPGPLNGTSEASAIWAHFVNVVDPQGLLCERFAVYTEGRRRRCFRCGGTGHIGPFYKASCLLRLILLSGAPWSTMDLFSPLPLL